MGFLKITRRHSAGTLKINDRRKKSDGTLEKIQHLIDPNDFVKDEKGNWFCKINAHDEAYVLSLHGGILEKVNDDPTA